MTNPISSLIPYKIRKTDPTSSLSRASSLKYKPSSLRFYEINRASYLLMLFLFFPPSQIQTQSWSQTPSYNFSLNAILHHPSCPPMPTTRLSNVLTHTSPNLSLHPPFLLPQALPLLALPHRFPRLIFPSTRTHD